MGKLSVFMHLSLDGCFAGPNGEIDWFKSVPRDEEFEAHTHEQSQAGGALVFGRATYDMMKSYWPTPQAMKDDPGMAKVVDQSPKLVFSKSLRQVDEGPNWKNITLLHEIDAADIRRRKADSRADLTILGSGSVVQQLANLGLIDEYTLVVVPLVLGAGRLLFQDVRKTSLELIESRSFRNGLALLRYKPG